MTQDGANRMKNLLISIPRILGAKLTHTILMVVYELNIANIVILANLTLNSYFKKFQRIGFCAMTPLKASYLVCMSIEC